ncbi:MAG TPA: DUF4412 domain-containing protein [Bacteroidales bacterium]|nr:DUF4412 domain-containing protein [Bacteroidales bacterium]HNV96425.1 DUF4412 domain-containing protein [Bacteroidales bacterium]HOU97241.1 DUF4412 domain-containing protein [Bacteroidales bacterium]
MKLFYVFCFCFSFYVLKAQPSATTDVTKNGNKSFEGVIFFSMEMLSDTMYYTYSIKDRNVRLDEYNRCKSCKFPDNYMLFDLDNKKITALNPQRKMYLHLTVNEFKEYNNNDDFIILKTNNSKKILGYKCYQWRVRNKKQNTEISYWVANDHFNFFIDYLKLWNRSERHATYFLRIPETQGFFPMLSEERTTLREQKMTLRVLSIQKKALDPSLFQIPKDYKSYEE